MTAMALGFGILLLMAALLWAIDDAHGTPVGFLANRSTILATLFGVLTLLAHDRLRRDGWRMGIVIGPLLLVLSLLSKEAGIATVGYLAAYSIFIDNSHFPRSFVNSFEL